MKESQEMKSEKVRTRRLTVAALAMFVLAVGVLGRYAYLQGQPRQSIRELRGPGYRQAPDITSDAKAQSLARAKELRDKWQPWAMEHKAELKQMLTAQAEDQVVLAKVWDELPTSPAQAGFTSQELAPNNDPTSASSFGWAPIEKTATKNLKPEMQQAVLKGVRQGDEMRQINFASHRDIVLATSLSGRTHLRLWASGRITEQGMVPAKDRAALVRKVKAEGRTLRPSDLYQEHKEVVPPYDFLQ